MNPDLTQVQRHQLEALAEDYAEDYAERKRLGESVSIEDYVEQHPQLASDTREMFPVVAMLDRAGAKN